MSWTSPEAPGQLNVVERRLLVEAVEHAESAPRVLIEVGTWLGGGSTMHLLQAMQSLGCGHLWGVEANPEIYEEMVANIRRCIPEAAERFTPLLGRSQTVIPEWIESFDRKLAVDFVFLDGGNSPNEQVQEFRILDPYIPVGGQLMSHDAKLRKGRWLVPYLRALDNWVVTVHDVSSEGLLHARKTASHPSSRSAAGARAKLQLLKLSPVELAARVVPPPVAGAAARVLPRRLRSRVFDGR